MGVLIVLVLLVIVGGVVLFGVGGFTAIRLIAQGERSRKRAEEDAPAILDAAFDGRADVVFKVNLESPSFETVVLGAKRRGYVLASQADDTKDRVAKTLLFERRADA